MLLNEQNYIIYICFLTKIESEIKQAIQYFLKLFDKSQKKNYYLKLNCQ